MRKTITIDSIFEGFMPSATFGGPNEYLGAIGIDPDVPLTDSATDIKTGGAIRPVQYAQFSSTEIDAAPIAILTNPKNSLTYVVLSNGKLVSYTSALTSAGAVSIGTVTGGAARGAFYYNNYIYIITGTDVSRYGPLDNSPSLTNTVWTGATLGSQVALVDTSYPVTLFNIGYLNHFGFVHSDGAAYFLDYKGGRGFIHKIQTTKVTSQGDTNDGSTYQSVGDLSLPHDFIPVTAESMGNDIVISGTKTTNTDINQGNACLFFWDAAEELFYRVVKLPDPICSNLKYINGVLYGLSGDINGGYRLFRYVGGDAIETLKIIEDGYPPLQMASDFAGNRLVWGANTTIPVVTSGLYAYGSKSDLFPKGLHHIAVSIFGAIVPSASPSKSPSLSPSKSPSLSPSLSPSKSPSVSPSVSPS